MMYMMYTDHIPPLPLFAWLVLECPFGWPPVVVAVRLSLPVRESRPTPRARLTIQRLAGWLAGWLVPEPTLDGGRCPLTDMSRMIWQVAGGRGRPGAGAAHGLGFAAGAAADRSQRAGGDVVHPRRERGARQPRRLPRAPPQEVCDAAQRPHAARALGLLAGAWDINGAVPCRLLTAPPGRLLLTEISPHATCGSCCHATEQSQRTGPPVAALRPALGPALRPRGQAPWQGAQLPSRSQLVVHAAGLAGIFPPLSPGLAGHTRRRPLRPFWRPFWLRSTYVKSVLAKKY
eukprot:COSAG01_NODE_4389_length_5071_cov_139.047246_8_plen_289_part_00